MSILQSPVPGRKTSYKPIPLSWSEPIPGEEFTTREHVYEASERLVQAGLSIIPIDAHEGTKAPDSSRLPCPHDRVTGKPRPSWSIYKLRRPTEAELGRWYEMDGLYGLAVIGGGVSGGLEVIDIDTVDLAQPWIEAVERVAPGLINRLVRVCTPRPGLHVYYRCPRYGTSQKLAFAAATDDFGHSAMDGQGNPVRKTLIEVKAEAGYCIIPPSPGRVHPTCRLYKYADGSSDLTRVPTITPGERTILLDAARSLNQWQENRTSQKPKPIMRKNPAISRPRDDFNARGKWEDILHGWTMVGQYGDEVRWCRPGKEGGVSATTNHHNSDLLHVFSSNTEHFEADRWYSKFSAYAWINHQGNYQEAARDLREQGYGKTLKSGKR
jgi:hypothetical protein